MKKLELAERTELKREPELGWVQKLEEGFLALEEKDITKNQLQAFHCFIANPDETEENIPGSSRTFCIWLRAAFFSISRSFTVIVYPSSGGGGCRQCYSDEYPLCKCVVEMCINTSFVTYQRNLISPVCGHQLDFALTFATAASRVRCRCCNRSLRFWSNFSW